MIDALLSRASTRFVFVLGKGGVGKTTTAGALALALADQAQPTHLISTDPAHSLGDLFQQDLTSGQTITSRCAAALVLEEFAARAYADRFFRELRAPLSELIERGTYLDADDAASFLDLSIPGIDEVMSVLRIVELHDGAAGRIIVDTAPTGHALRLIDAATTIDSWVNAGRAMAEKASAVAVAMVGRRMPLQAELLLDGWRAKVQRFDEQVLRAASAVIVTTAGDVVAAETQRLRADIAERGLRLAAVVSTGSAAEESDFAVESMSELIGCAALRAWRSHIYVAAQLPAAARTPAQSVPAQTAAVAAWLNALPLKLLWVAGKGGVGKSTCAAAIATTIAANRKVCIVSTDPAGSLSEVFDVAVGTPPIEVHPGLYARQIDAAAEFERMRTQYRDAVEVVFQSIGLDQSARLDRRVVEALWDFAPPGLDEIIALIEILEHAPEFDAVIVDSAPTGHFLRLIEMPEIALDWVHALMRLLVKYGALASLDALGHDLLAFAKRLRQLKLDLSASGTAGVILVTLAEPMVEAETARLAARLRRAGVPIAATILNRADDGLRERSLPKEAAASQRWIRSPESDREITGRAVLRSFLAQWEFFR